jgi:hypothetical protein
VEIYKIIIYIRKNKNMKIAQYHSTDLSVKNFKLRKKKWSTLKVTHGSKLKNHVGQPSRHGTWRKAALMVVISSHLLFLNQMLNLLIPLYSQDVCRKLFLDQSLL